MHIIMQFDQIILIVALLCVAGILFWGVITMARGGAYNVKKLKPDYAIPDYISGDRIDFDLGLDVVSKQQWLTPPAWPHLAVMPIK